MIIRSTRVVLPDGMRRASIDIQNGRIASIGSYDENGRSGPDDLDAGNLVVSPGIVDTHVHVNEPGRTEWEGFDTATRAAAAGGVTTIVDMPLNSVPATTTVEALDAKREAARRASHVDVAFWGGVVPGHEGHLDGLVDAGVRGFKCFLVPSGVDEFPCVDETELRRALPILVRRDVPLLVHAESPRVIQRSAERLRSADAFTLRASYSFYLATRPAEAEVEAIRLMVGLAEEFGARVHIVHVAAAEAAHEIAAAKARGVPVTAETCPHYLTFAAEEVPDGATAFKCAPPIRDARHREALWDALAAGTLDLVATDHSPAPPALKCQGNFLRAWGGIASLELSLSAVWTAAIVRLGDARLKPSRYVDFARWMSAAPAALAGLDHRKGSIAVGRDADLIIWDSDAEFTVEPGRLQQRHKLTPYAGRTLRGVVHSTFVRGACVWHEGHLVCERSGELL